MPNQQSLVTQAQDDLIIDRILTEVNITAILKEVDSLKVHGPGNLSVADVEKLGKLTSERTNLGIVNEIREELITYVKEKLAKHVHDGLGSGQTKDNVALSLLDFVTLKYQSEFNKLIEKIEKHKKDNRIWSLHLHIVSVKRCMGTAIQRLIRSDNDIHDVMEALAAQQDKPLIELFGQNEP